MAGGKGGTTTQRQEIPEWQKKEIMEAIQKSKDMNISYAPNMAVDVIAQAKGINDNLNLGLSAFGMNPMQSVLPEAVEQGGLRGFRSFDVYQDTMNRFKEEYPDIFRRIEGLTAETAVPQTMDVMQPAMNNAGMMNPVTGMPIVPETSQPGYESRAEYQAGIEAQKNADTSGRFRTLMEDNDPSGYIDPLDAIFGGDTSYDLNRD
tara:strand:- start:446 stop:1060 length:615 start_codon:yes stop_codon:yes gene_type:complete